MLPANQKDHLMSYRKIFSSSLMAISLTAASVPLAGQAFAHAHLVWAVPGDMAMTMPSPHDIKIKFSEAIELKFSKIILKGPDKAVIPTGPVQLDPNDNTVLIITLTAPLADGKYTVEWQVVAKDGHKTKGSYHFDSMK
jgi:methionine-rich copper-binding protein CopC